MEVSWIWIPSLQKYAYSRWRDFKRRGISWKQRDNCFTVLSSWQLTTKFSVAKYQQSFCHFTAAPQEHQVKIFRKAILMLSVLISYIMPEIVPGNGNVMVYSNKLLVWFYQTAPCQKAFTGTLLNLRCSRDPCQVSLHMDILLWGQGTWQNFSTKKRAGGREAGGEEIQ